MTLLFDRRVSVTLQEVTVSGAGSKSTVTVNPDFVPGFDPMSPLRVRFELEKSMESEPNHAKIEIWNLNPTNRGAIAKDYLLTLRAGYADDSKSPTGIPILFKGNVATVTQTKERTGWKTTITCGDGSKAFKLGLMNDLVPTETSISEVFDRVKKKFEDLAIEVQGDFTQSILSWVTEQWRKASSNPSTEGTDTGGDDLLKAPKALVGKLSDILTQETDRLNLSWSIQNNVLTVRPKGGSDAQPAIILSPETGLLGSPERNERGGVAGRALMNTGIEPGRKIEVQSRVITGNYVVSKAHFTGDTEGPDFFVDFEAFVEGTEIKIGG